MRELLEAQTPERTDGVERRGFEWHYWWHLSHAELQNFKGYGNAVCYSRDVPISWVGWVLGMSEAPRRLVGLTGGPC
jgi:hypothetical protein